ncbi:MAG TPA: flagellar hook capping FlgD N-terminal domain-containing protein [Gemmatimonadales bacterium]|nr:flagellar hook capping FlgD N-terminal domain-containing protein [Gemmatimonadales bacterium]
MTAVQPTGTTSSSAAATTTSAPSSSLGENDFLKILVSQLKNQDPLNPMDGEQFAAQLAQFSSLEQLIQINSALGRQSSASGQATAVNQAALAASLIGRNVEASGDQIQVGASADNLSVTVEVGGTGGTAQVQVLDASGKALCTHDLGAVGGGTQKLSWSNDANGTPELAAGTYTYKVTVTASDGSAVTVTPYITGTVDGVEMQQSGVVLRIGGISVPIGSLVAIEPSSSGLTAGNTSPFASERLSL